MKRQIAAWEQEYLGAGKMRIESSYTNQAEPSVFWFQQQLLRRGMAKGKILDLGCGRGRNALVFLNRGWQVTAVDAAWPALREFKRLAGLRAGAKALKLQRLDFQQPLPFGREAFDAAMEITAADNLTNLRGRRRFWREVCRVLKPGGWFFSYHFTRQDGYYGPLLKQSRARSRGLLFDRRGHMHFRFYGPREIVAATQNRLQPAARRHYQYPGPMFGQVYLRDLHAVIFRKKAE
jgi:SAM-dependent methyltransferase